MGRTGYDGGAEDHEDHHRLLQGTGNLMENCAKDAEDLVGYTIRDQDEKEVAIRSVEYGVEILARLEAGKKTRSTYGMGKVMYARTAAHIGRQTNIWYRLEQGGMGGAAPVDGRTMWATLPIHELPDVAFIIHHCEHGHVEDDLQHWVVGP